MHRIDRASPFFGLKQTDIQSSDLVLILMMTGVEQNLHDMIHERHEYDSESMRWAARFVAMMDWSSKRQCLDFDFAKVSAVISQPLQRSYSSVAEIEDSPESGSEGDEEEDDSTVPSEDQAHDGGDEENAETTKQSATETKIPPFTRHSTSHEFSESKNDEPASKARRRAQFKNHPMNRLFSKGLYYRALETSWTRFMLWLVVIYFATISITAAILYIVVRLYVSHLILP